MVSNILRNPNISYQIKKPLVQLLKNVLILVIVVILAYYRDYILALDINELLLGLSLLGTILLWRQSSISSSNSFQSKIKGKMNSRYIHNFPVGKHTIEIKDVRFFENSGSLFYPIRKYIFGLEGEIEIKGKVNIQSIDYSMFYRDLLKDEDEFQSKFFVEFKRDKIRIVTISKDIEEIERFINKTNRAIFSSTSKAGDRQDIGRVFSHPAVILGVNPNSITSLIGYVFRFYISSKYHRVGYPGLFNCLMYKPDSYQNMNIKGIGLSFCFFKLSNPSILLNDFEPLWVINLKSLISEYKSYNESKAEKLECNEKILIVSTKISSKFAKNNYYQHKNLNVSQTSSQLKEKPIFSQSSNPVTYSSFKEFYEIFMAAFKYHSGKDIGTDILVNIPLRTTLEKLNVNDGLSVSKKKNVTIDYTSEIIAQIAVIRSFGVEVAYRIEDKMAIVQFLGNQPELRYYGEAHYDFLTQNKVIWAAPDIYAKNLKYPTHTEDRVFIRDGQKYKNDYMIIAENFDFDDFKRL